MGLSPCSVSVQIWEERGKSTKSFSTPRTRYGGGPVKMHMDCVTPETPLPMTQ